ncbi:MATE family efflux transporter [Bradyrhizobium sp. U531]|uniref:MATE family efflux transporter n=1 Tax=Bradyrhizobium sp. U531 TaxID=3053458 RepID=UPI003F42F7ED
MDSISETKSHSASPHVPRGQAARRGVALELGAITRLAGPMVLIQVGQIAMMTTDLVFVGRIGGEALAGAALAGRVYLVGFAVGMGLLAPIAPLTAEAFGAHNLALVRRSLRMGLWAAVLVSIPTIAFALRGEQTLLALSQAPQAARLAQEYLSGLAWGVVPTMCFLAIRNFMGAVTRPEPILWITLSAIPLNALLVYVLMNGKFGFPQLDLFGVGLATATVNWGTCLAGFWFVTMGTPVRTYRALARFWRLDWPVMRELISIGVPMSFAVLIEYGLVSAAALLAGSISANALAAHQIALQVAGILFMIPVGISMAATVRVGHALGRNDGPGVKRAGLVAILLGVAIAVTLTFAVVAIRFELPKLFLSDRTSDAEATIKLAATLLLVGATFFTSSATHTIATGCLRGLKDTRVPLWLAGVAYWVVGFSLSYVLSLKVGLGAVGIWIGLSIGTTLYAGLVVLRFQLLANRLALR